MAELLVKIDAARSADIAHLVKLLEELFAVELDFTADAERQARGLALLIEESGRGERVTVAVARDATGVAVAMASAQLVISTAEGAYSAWIEDVVVHPEHRGRGIARSLVEHLSGWARERGATRVQLVADAGNDPAQNFYDSLGWERTNLELRRRRTGG